MAIHTSPIRQVVKVIDADIVSDATFLAATEARKAGIVYFHPVLVDSDILSLPRSFTLKAGGDTAEHLERTPGAERAGAYSTGATTLLKFEFTVEFWILTWVQVLGCPSYLLIRVEWHDDGWSVGWLRNEPIQLSWLLVSFLVPSKKD